MIRWMIAKTKAHSNPIKDWFDAVDLLVTKGWIPTHQNNELGIMKDRFFISLNVFKG